MVVHETFNIDPGLEFLCVVAVLPVNLLMYSFTDSFTVCIRLIYYSLTDYDNSFN